ASRIAILILCMVILYTKAALTGMREYGNLLSHFRLEHLTLIFVVWLTLSWLFQHLIRRPRGIEIIPYVWAAMDVGILTTTLLLTGSLGSPIDIGYPLLIAASGLWLRPQLVWFTTGCTLFAYGVATLAMLAGGQEQLHRHVIFTAGPGTEAYSVLYQGERFCALSPLYGGPPGG